MVTEHVFEFEMKLSERGHDDRFCRLRMVFNKFVGPPPSVCQDLCHTSPKLTLFAIGKILFFCLCRERAASCLTEIVFLKIKYIYYCSPLMLNFTIL